jgi:hypothetical protein
VSINVHFETYAICLRWCLCNVEPWLGHLMCSVFSVQFESVTVEPSELSMRSCVPRYPVHICTRTFYMNYEICRNDYKRGDDAIYARQSYSSLNVCIAGVVQIILSRSLNLVVCMTLCVTAYCQNCLFSL